MMACRQGRRKEGLRPCGSVQGAAPAHTRPLVRRAGEVDAGALEGVLQVKMALGAPGRDAVDLLEALDGGLADPGAQRGFAHAPAQHAPRGADLDTRQQHLIRLIQRFSDTNWIFYELYWLY